MKLQTIPQLKKGRVFLDKTPKYLQNARSIKLKGVSLKENQSKSYFILRNRLKQTTDDIKIRHRTPLSSNSLYHRIMDFIKQSQMNNRNLSLYEKQRVYEKSPKTLSKLIDNNMNCKQQANSPDVHLFSNKHLIKNIKMQDVLKTGKNYSGYKKCYHKNQNKFSKIRYV